MDTFGKRLRQAREAKGWSQEKLGFEIDTTKATISKWETGKSEPGLRHLARLRTELVDEIGSLDYLICDDLKAAGYAKSAKLIMEAKAQYAVDPRRAQSEAELSLLMRFRGYAAKKQKAILDFMGINTPEE